MNRNLSLGVSFSSIPFPRFRYRARGGGSIEGDRDEREAIVLGNLTKCRVGFGDRGIVMCGYRNERRDSEGIERCGKGGRDVVQDLLVNLLDEKTTYTHSSFYVRFLNKLDEEFNLYIIIRI